MKTIHLYTDGGCRGNPGVGGWGAYIRYGDHEKELWGGEAHTTNNRMELRAAIEGLKVLKEMCSVVLTTDSQYVKNGVTTWMTKWKKNNWKTADKKPVKNQDLWEQLDIEIQKHHVTWHWVKGHSGHDENEIADRLANRAMDELGG